MIYDTLVGGSERASEKARDRVSQGAGERVSEKTSERERKRARERQPYSNNTQITGEISGATSSPERKKEHLVLMGLTAPPPALDTNPHVELRNLRRQSLHHRVNTLLNVKSYNKYTDWIR